MAWWHNNWRGHWRQYEGNMENMHFVISWQKPEVKAVVGSMQRGLERFARQARRPIIDACIAFSHWSWNDDINRSDILPEWSPSPHFNGIMNDIYVTNVGWKHTLGCKVIQVTQPGPVLWTPPPGRPQPPQVDTVVRIQVEFIQVHPREQVNRAMEQVDREAEGDRAMEHGEYRDDAGEYLARIGRYEYEWDRPCMDGA